MIRSLLFAFLGLVAGVVVAGVLVIGVEAISSIVHPPPAGVSELKGEAFFEAMCTHVAAYPVWVLAVVVLLWGLTISVAVGVGALIGGRVAGSLVGLLLFAMLLLNVWLMGLPYPLWFKVVEVVTFPLFFLAGLYLVTAKKPPSTQLAA